MQPGGPDVQVFGYKGKQVRDNIHSHDVARFIEAFCATPRCGRGLQHRRRAGELVFASWKRSTGSPRSAARRCSYEYVDKNREGDHICYISDLRKMKAHYPGVGHHQDRSTKFSARRPRLAGADAVVL